MKTFFSGVWKHLMHNHKAIERHFDRNIPWFILSLKVKLWRRLTHVAMVVSGLELPNKGLQRRKMLLGLVVGMMKVVQ